MILSIFHRFNCFVKRLSLLNLFVLLNVLDLLINFFVNLNLSIFIDNNAFCLQIVVLLYFDFLVVENI